MITTPLPAFVVLPPPEFVTYKDFSTLFSTSTQLLLTPLNTPSTSVALNHTKLLEDIVEVSAAPYTITMDQQSNVIIERNANETTDIYNDFLTITIEVNQQNVRQDLFEGVPLPSFYDVVHPTTKQPLGQVIGDGYLVSSSGSEFVTSVNRVLVCVTRPSTVPQVRSNLFSIPTLVKRVATTEKKGEQIVYEFQPVDAQFVEEVVVAGNQICARVSMPVVQGKNTVVISLYPALLQSVTPSPRSSTPSTPVAPASLVSLGLVSIFFVLAFL